MTNFGIYKKTLCFSLIKILVAIVGLGIAVGVTLLVYYLSGGNNDEARLLYTGGGAVVGLIIYGTIMHFASYLLVAGHIAMITRGVTENELPEHVFKEGVAMVKARFVTVTVYFALLRITRGISNQITRGLSFLADTTDNDAVGIVVAIINIIVSIVLTYINYCCLGWVFCNPQQSAVKSTCDGAVIYFKNWKTLLKNIGKILGLGLASLIVIGGIFVGIFYLSTQNVDFPDLVAQGFEISALGVRWIAIGVMSFICWLVIHSALIQPYVLISVMRAYIDSAKSTPFTSELYNKLCGMSKSFKKAFSESQKENTPVGV